MSNLKSLKSGAYTGSAVCGNPYSGDMGKGIGYDLYEAYSTTEAIVGGVCVVVDGATETGVKVVP